MLMRAAQYGISSKLLALLGGLNSGGAPSLGGAKTNNKDLIDATEEKLLNDKEKEAKGTSWD